MYGQEQVTKQLTAHLPCPRDAWFSMGTSSTVTFPMRYNILSVLLWKTVLKQKSAASDDSGNEEKLKTSKKPLFFSRNSSYLRETVCGIGGQPRGKSWSPQNAFLMSRKALFCVKHIAGGRKSQEKLREGGDLGADSWKISHIVTMWLRSNDEKDHSLFGKYWWKTKQRDFCFWPRRSDRDSIYPLIRIKQ